jgi:hypothetical protein
LEQEQKLTGNVQAVFLEDQIKPTTWLTLTGGVRFTHFLGSFSENVTTPRGGVAIRVPRLNWVMHGFYGRYYQAPPLSTVSGPLLEFALSQGFDFLPLHGERDEEHQRLTIPRRGWSSTPTISHSSQEFFDHEVLETPTSSSRHHPGALIRGPKSLRSPRPWGRGQLAVAYSNQIAQAGCRYRGLTDSLRLRKDTFLDHDQRNTLNAGLNILLPKHSFAAANFHYGSGFLDGEGPEHLPGHTTFVLSWGKAFGEKWSISIQALNVANRRFLLDNSETFGGTHFVDPRQIYAEVRYRFHY